MRPPVSSSECTINSTDRTLRFRPLLRLLTRCALARCSPFFCVFPLARPACSNGLSTLPFVPPAAHLCCRAVPLHRWPQRALLRLHRCRHSGWRNSSPVRRSCKGWRRRMLWHSCTAFNRLMQLVLRLEWAAEVAVVAAATATLALPHRRFTRLACVIAPPPPRHRPPWPHRPPPSWASSRRRHPPSSRRMVMAGPARPLSTCATCRAGIPRRCPTTRTARRATGPLSLKPRLPVRRKQTRHRLRPPARRRRRLLLPHPPAHCRCASASTRPRSDVCLANNRQRAVPFLPHLPLQPRHRRQHPTQIHPRPLVLHLLPSPRPRATSPPRPLLRRPPLPSPPPPRRPFRPPSRRRHCCRRPRQMQTWHGSCRRRKCWRQQKSNRGEMERVLSDDSLRRCNNATRAFKALPAAALCPCNLFP